MKTNLQLVEPVMGRSIDDFLANIDQEQETGEASSWAEKRLATLVPSSDEATITIDLLGDISTCFPSVEAFDACALSLHQWLLGFGGRENMECFSRAIGASAEAYQACIGVSEESISTDLVDLSDSAAEKIRERCTFKIDAFLPDFECEISIYEGKFLTDIKPQDQEIVVVAGHIIGDIEDEGPRLVSGANIPIDINGHVEVLEILSGRKGIMLKVNVHNISSNRTFGPIMVFDRDAVNTLMSYRGWDNINFECTIAQPVNSSHLPVMIECGHWPEFLTGRTNMAA